MIGSSYFKLFFIFTWLDFSKGGRTSAVLVNTVNNFLRGGVWMDWISEFQWKLRHRVALTFN